MCGILVILSKNKKLNKKKCFLSTKSINQRGPDKKLWNFFEKNKLFIFNSILSITGKINSKNNNLYNSENKNYYLSFNGEIYNYYSLKNKLKEIKNYDLSNDSKVLVNLFENYKKENISNLINGMFAYVIYDHKYKKIFFSTDPQGEKRLYKYEDKEVFILSSTPKSIKEYLGECKFNINSFRDYFATRHFLMMEKTIYKKISIINTGCFFEYSTKNYTLKKTNYDNPLNWIDENKYRYFNSLNENELIEYFHDLFLNQLKLMIPKVKYGSVFSGGIDSSLQTAMISKLDKNFIPATIHHQNKDKITEKIELFEPYIQKKIHKFNANIKLNKIDAVKCSSVIGIPFLTHDFVGRYQISNYFKSKKCKVFFGGDGADELFGGYELYRRLNWKRKGKKNISEYSSFLIRNYVKGKNFSLKKKMEKFYFDVYQRCSFIKSYERNIQSSLFTDYFLSAVSVYNIGTDLVACSNAIEPRNLFIQKEIIKNIINLPAKYKINLYSKDKKFILKPLLKKIFLKYFSKNLIFEKQGFSGYPNELKPILRNQDLNYLHNFKILHKINNFDRSIEWKIINLKIFFENNKYIN
tara:strand:- start:584 stop:2329 length:1746 start_codon:yes stop_codon:yes gene_type:complete